MTRRRIRKPLFLLFVVAVLLWWSGLAVQAGAYAKVVTVAALPNEVLGLVMGWPRERVKWYRVYYQDGVVRAQQGTGFK